MIENNWRGPCKVILKDLIGEDPSIYIKDLLIHFLDIREITVFSTLTYEESCKPLAGV